MENDGLRMRRRRFQARGRRNLVVLLTKSKSLRKSWRQDIMNSRESNGEAMRGEE